MKLPTDPISPAIVTEFGRLKTLVDSRSTAAEIAASSLQLSALMEGEGLRQSQFDLYMEIRETLVDAFSMLSEQLKGRHSCPTTAVIDTAQMATKAPLLRTVAAEECVAA